MRGGRRGAIGAVGLDRAVAQVVDPAARGGDFGARRNLGDGHSGAAAGPGEHLSLGVDHLGLADEAQRADLAGQVGGDPDHLVLQRPRFVEQVEVAGLAVGGDAPRRVAPVERPGGERGDRLGAVERQRARRLGEEFVVADQHPDPTDRGVEGGEAVAGREGFALARRQVDLALVPEHALAVDADGARVGPSRPALGEAGADDRVARDLAEPGDLRAVEGDRPRVAAVWAQVAAERALRQHDELRAGAASRLDRGRYPRRPGLAPAPERPRNRSVGVGARPHVRMMNLAGRRV